MAVRASHISEWFNRISSQDTNPSSKFFTMTAFLPAYRPPRRITTYTIKTRRTNFREPSFPPRICALYSVKMSLPTNATLCRANKTQNASRHLPLAQVKRLNRARVSGYRGWPKLPDEICQWSLRPKRTQANSPMERLQKAMLGLQWSHINLLKKSLRTSFSALPKQSPKR